MIPFNKISITDIEKKFVLDSINGNKICGDGLYTKKCYEFFKEKFNIKNILLTTSCSHALDIAAILLDLKQGDEVIVPSYTFVSTANSFLLRGAKPVFVDVEKDTMNIDANLIEEKITDKTKAIFPVHYAGVACDMDKIMKIAKKYNLKVVEDAAQAIGSFYKGKPLGTIGDIGCFSFHETKNYAMGEGGAIIVKDDSEFLKAEIIREKGTDRSQFIKGNIDKYTWHSVGSSYLPSDILAALLFGQLTRFDEIMNKRMNAWNIYNIKLEKLENEGKLKRQFIPDEKIHNAHMYYIILPDEDTRNNVIKCLKEKEIYSAFHYIPLHTSPMGKKLNYKKGDLPITEEYSKRLLRLPLWADIKDNEVEYICNCLEEIL